MEDHLHHHLESKSNIGEYLKFAGVLVAIIILSVIINGNSSVSFMEIFMGVFFAVFGGFKLINLKEFAYGFQSYDLIAKNSLPYSYSYPFIQLSFAFLYLFGAGSIWWVNIAVLFVSLLSGAGVLRTLGSGAKVHCVCLGNVIKLPLSTISFVEDFGMALMALLILIS